MSVKEAVLLLRTHLGLEGPAFGKVVGVSRQSVSYWERGTYPPRRTHLARLVTLARTSKAPKDVTAALREAMSEGTEARA